VFELSNAYHYREGDLPLESPTLVVLWDGKKFAEAKGLAQELFRLFGVPMPEKEYIRTKSSPDWYSGHALSMDRYGSLGELNPGLLSRAGIHVPVTRLSLQFAELVTHANQLSSYTPIPKYPPAVEDLAFTVSAGFRIGPFMEALKKAHPLVYRVSLLDTHGTTRTVHIEYLDESKNLTATDIRPVREQLITLARDEFDARLKLI
jgi:phenylalanyl-tRNA synthetase beta subunit